MKVGVISDTHGLLRPEALAALEGCERIIHAGDIGSPDILDQLASIAPLHVVRGNNDVGAPWAAHLDDLLRFDLKGWGTLLVHDIADVPAALDAGIKLVITGHLAQAMHRMARRSAVPQSRQRGAAAFPSCR